MTVRTKLGAVEMCDGVTFVAEAAQRPGVVKWNGGPVGGTFWQDQETGDYYGYAGGSCRQTYPTMIRAMRTCIEGQAREYNRAKLLVERYEKAKG